MVIFNSYVSLPEGISTVNYSSRRQINQLSSRTAAPPCCICCESVHSLPHRLPQQGPRALHGPPMARKPCQPESLWPHWNGWGKQLRCSQKFQLVGLEPWNFDWLSRNSWGHGITSQLTKSHFFPVAKNHQPEMPWTWDSNSMGFHQPDDLFSQIYVQQGLDQKKKITSKNEDVTIKYKDLANELWDLHGNIMHNLDSVKTQSVNLPANWVPQYLATRAQTIPWSLCRGTKLNVRSVCLLDVKHSTGERWPWQFLWFREKSMARSSFSTSHDTAITRDYCKKKFFRQLYKNV